VKSPVVWPSDLVALDWGSKVGMVVLRSTYQNPLFILRRKFSSHSFPTCHQVSWVTPQVILWYRRYPQKVYPICQLTVTDRNRIASPVAGGTAGIPTRNGPGGACWTFKCRLYSSMSSSTSHVCLCSRHSYRASQDDSLISPEV
jgi:hypothetical protein